MKAELEELQKIRELLEDIKGELGDVGLPETCDAVRALCAPFVVRVKTTLKHPHENEAITQAVPVGVRTSRNGNGAWKAKGEEEVIETVLQAFGTLQAPVIVGFTKPELDGQLNSDTIRA